MPNRSSIYKAGKRGNPRLQAANKGNTEILDLWVAQCPECLSLTVSISQIVGNVERLQIIWPLSSGRPPAPPEVPNRIAQDYDEAAIVLPFSPKASAALSRRCLQVLLWEAGNTKAKNLSRQIDEALPSLPTYIAENLDAVRQIGNFAAHEQKSQNTGAVLDVEPGEAEWNLDVLEALFDLSLAKMS